MMDSRIPKLVKEIINREVSGKTYMEILTMKDTPIGVDILFRNFADIQECFADIKYVLDENLPEATLQRTTDDTIAIDAQHCSIEYRVYDDYGMCDDVFDKYEDAVDAFDVNKRALAGAIYNYHYYKDPSSYPLWEEILIEIEYYIQGCTHVAFSDKQEWITIKSAPKFVADFIRKNSNLLKKDKIKELIRKADVYVPNSGGKIVKDFLIGAGADIRSIKENN